LYALHVASRSWNSLPSEVIIIIIIKSIYTRRLKAKSH